MDNSENICLQVVNKLNTLNKDEFSASINII